MDLSKNYRFEPAADNPPKEEIDYLGYHPDKGLCFTDFMDGEFYPEVSHYLVVVDNPLDKYAQASVNETINNLEMQLEKASEGFITPRDLFAAAALFGEFMSDRGSSAEQAAKLAYKVADEMLKVREAENG